MKLAALRIRNFRTLEHIDLRFPSSYTVVCGKNDCGKTNIIRAIRALVKEEDPFPLQVEEDISFKNDFPKWKEAAATDREITVAVDVIVNKDQDAGLYDFIDTYLSLEWEEEELFFTVEATYSVEAPEQRVTVTVRENVFEGIKAQEVLKKLQSSRVVFFHNSTDPMLSYRYGRGLLRDVSEEHKEQIESLQKTVSKGLQKIAKGQQKELAELLGRLEAKYRVGLSLPTFDFSFMPFNVTLGDQKIDVPLDDWGSGTQNRTLILLNMLRARQVSESEASASKITPIIVIEEPESFLHPSAQAEFGRVLQDLAEELEVQTIVTSHSPYMLSLDNPESNKLLERNVVRSQLRETRMVDTAGDNWMEPFGLVLGLDNEQFEPWKDVLFSHSEYVLLVEGDTDKEYLELLRDPRHGSNQLKFVGDIFAYNGRDNLRNEVLLKFVNSRYKKVFITYDLDAADVIENRLNALGLHKGKNYCAVGIDAPGKKSIEGLVPEGIKREVWSANPGLVEQVMSGSTREQRDAKNRLKRFILEEFKERAVPGDEFYKNFYPIGKLIDKALC